MGYINEQQHVNFLKTTVNCLQNNDRLHQDVLANVLCCVFKVDRFFEEFFYQLHAEQLLNNTLLVFLSDHGFRFGSYRNTPIGK